MIPQEYRRLEDRVRQEAEREGMRLEHSPEQGGSPYLLVNTKPIPLLGLVAWPWQTLAELVDLMFGEHEPEFTHTGNTLHRNPKGGVGRDHEPRSAPR